jgi:hypothetical protein
MKRWNSFLLEYWPINQTKRRYKRGGSKTFIKQFRSHIFLEIPIRLSLLLRGFASALEQPGSEMESDRPFLLFERLAALIFCRLTFRVASASSPQTYHLDHHFSRSALKRKLIFFFLFFSLFLWRIIFCGASLPSFEEILLTCYFCARALSLPFTRAFLTHFWMTFINVMEAILPKPAFYSLIFSKLKVAPDRLRTLNSRAMWLRSRIDVE